MSTPFMVKQTITYSDGTETVVNYVDNPDRQEIEATVAEAVEGDHKVSDEVEAPKKKKKKVVDEQEEV